MMGESTADAHFSDGASGSARHDFTVEADAAGQRLDRWLAAVIPDTSRSEVQRWIRAGQVLVNGAPEKSSYVLELEDEIKVTAVERSLPSDQAPVAEAIPLRIVYEDADILVVDKAAGMVVHPAPGHPAGTLVNALLHHSNRLSGEVGDTRPGIVHRLDKDTSGLLLVARHDRALRYLQQQFKSRTVEKEYLALVDGVPEDQTIDVPLGRHPVDRKRQAALPNDVHAPGIRVRPAQTELVRHQVYSVPVRGATATGSFSLISAFPKTGRTHQIRVHLAWIKHPIVGDPLYGIYPPRLQVPRMFLHAHRLRFRLPATESLVEFVSPLPPELATIINALERSAD